MRAVLDGEIINSAKNEQSLIEEKRINGTISYLAMFKTINKTGL